jgi:hypothetical protein
VIKLLNNKYVQFALILVLGIAIGALFYPTKNIEERLKKEHEQHISQIKSESESVKASLKEEISSLSKEKTQIQIESSSRISSLQQEIRSLESSTRETYYKIIRPDGTIEEKRYTESEVSENSTVVTRVRQEFDTKVVQISERWQRVHRTRVEELKREFDAKEEEYKRTITKLESSKSIQINPKRYGVELGYTSGNLYYGHVTMDVFGPLFVGLHTESNLGDKHSVGAGVGIKF